MAKGETEMREAARRLGVVPVVASLVGVLTSCTGSGASPESSLLTWDQMNRSYQQTVVDFPYELPKGFTFPKDAPALEPDSKSQLYASGVGGMQVYFFYQCAQESVALANQTSDPPRALKALDAITEMNKSPFWQAHYEDGDGGFAGILAKARLGDYAQLAEFYDGDCSDDWSQGKVK